MTLIEQISLVSFAVIVVFGMAAYLRSHSQYENGIFHKAGCLLMYGYLKISLAAGYVRRAVMMDLEIIRIYNKKLIFRNSSVILHSRGISFWRSANG